MNKRVNLVPSPTTLYRARTGTLQLEPFHIERRHPDGYTNCEICKVNTTEDIEHFLLDCEALTSTRQYVTGLQRPYKENRETHIAEFLLFNNKINHNIIFRNRDDLQRLWQHRNSIMLQILIIILLKVYNTLYANVVTSFINELRKVPLQRLYLPQSTTMYVWNRRSNNRTHTENMSIIPTSHRTDMIRQNIRSCMGRKNN